MMRLVLPIVLGCLMLIGSPFLSAQEPGSTPARPLFNGVDLTGWVRVNTPEETWSVQEGMLVCSGKPIGELRTDRM
ncbi:MAG: family 16 glycoside hydrolase [Pirellulaceae bacterium]